jgi:hypothetical protein
MERTAAFHHEITDAILPQPEPVFRHAAALDAAVDRLDPPPPVVQGLIGPLVFQGAFLPSWFLRRHEDLDLGQRKRQEAQILSQPAPRGQGRRRRVSHGLILDATAIGVAQEEEEEERIH